MDMDRANSELTAMQAIASALSALPDGESRNRVLRWASEHFDSELVPTVVTSIRAAAPAAAEIVEIDHAAGLLVQPCDLREPCDPENLDSLFEERQTPGPVAAPRGRKPKSVVSSLESFVADFQKLAHDWQNA
jgi:hypothetical protein